MRKFGIFLTSVLLIAVLVLIVISSGLLPYVFPVTNDQAKIPQVTIPFTSKKVEVETLELSATTNLVILSQGGEVVVHGTERDSFEITLEKQSQSPNPLRAKQLLEQLIITVNSADETTTIEVATPETARGEQAVANLVLWVPKDPNLNLKIYTNLGGIKVQDVQGNVALESTLGNIWVHNSSFQEEFMALTNLGDLHIHGELGKTNVIESKLGDLELLLSPEPSYVLEGQIELGNFTTEVPFKGLQTKPQIKGILGTGEQRGHLLVNLTLGSIQVKNQND